MPEIRSKFENDFVADPNKSAKGVKVDEMVATKDNIQTAASALSQGKMPTTQQITQALDSAMDSKFLPEEVNLSASGQRIADKFDDVLDSTKRLVNEKNKGDVIQKLIHHAKIASLELENEDTPDYEHQARDSQQLLRRAYNELIIISNLTVTSNEFRALIIDAYNLIRDILKDNVPGAEHLPRAEQLTDEQGRFDSEKAKHQAQTAANKMKDDAYDSLSPEDKRKVDQLKHGDTKDVKNLASNLVGEAVQGLAQKAKPAVDAASKGNTKQAGDHAKHEMNKTQGEAKGLYEQTKNEAQNAMNKAGETMENIKEDFNLSEKQKDRLVDRLVSIVSEIQRNARTHRAIDGLIDVVAGLNHNAKTVAAKTKSKASEVANENDNVQQAVHNAKLAVENFAGNHSLDKLFNMIYKFGEMIESDKELGNVMHENVKFIKRSLKESNFISRRNYGDLAEKRFNETRRLLLQKYRQPLDNLINEASSIAKALKEDPTTNNLIKDLEELTREIFLDKDGKPTIKYDLLQDFQKIVPVMAKKLELIELPRIVDHDDDNEYILDNLKLECSNIVPKIVRVRTDTMFDTEYERLINAVSIKLQGIQARAREVAFYYKRKVAFMNMEDAGIADITIPNDGLDIYLKLAPPLVSSQIMDKTPENQRPFRVLYSKVKINEIDIKFHHTKFGPIYKLFNKMIQNQVKKEIETKIADGVRQFLEGLEGTITRGVEFYSKDQKSIQGQEKQIDTRPDGWKSHAFDVTK